MNYIRLELPCGALECGISDARLHALNAVVANKPDSAVVVEIRQPNNFGKTPGTRLNLNVQTGKCTGCSEEEEGAPYHCPHSGFIDNLVSTVFPSKSR